MGLYGTLAEALRYPVSGRMALLERELDGMAGGRRKKLLAAFLKSIQSVSLGEWEELYTRTWDLDPITAPYIGFQIWGEHYQRGNLMALLRREYNRAGVELEGELPDHLVPVLRYLDKVDTPVPELAEALPKASQKMLSALKKVEPSNPYLRLLEAVLPDENVNRNGGLDELE